MTRLATALIAILALALLAGCGGGDKKTIPNAQGASLIRALRQARDLAGDSKNCPQLQTAVQRVQERVASLPPSVDKNTRDSLVNGTNNLISDAQSDCQNVQTTPTTPTTPTTTQPTQTQPTQTQTQPTQTQTTPTAPTTPTGTTPAPGNGGVSPGNTPQVAPGQGRKHGKQGGEG
jgi:hypothetical protein